MHDQANHFSRRKFLTASTGLLAMPSVFKNFRPIEISRLKTITINEVIEMIKKEAAIGALNGTVDTIKSGDGAMEVKGIVTTMFATVDVIRKAKDVQANFIIAHEPTFYNHTDETQWLAGDGVYEYKKDLLEKNKIVVWRLHDYIHSFRPDGVLMGVLDALEWKKYYRPEQPMALTIPAMKLGDIIALVRSKLKIEKLRYIGDLAQSCEKVTLVPGAAGGRMQISTIMKYSPDVMICGEVSEWETSEYIRDAQAMGRKQSLIVLGHAMSEEPGMEWLMQWMQPKLPSIKITHIPSNSPFSWT